MLFGMFEKLYTDDGQSKRLNVVMWSSTTQSDAVFRLPM